ncbi:MAG: hypothetical protein ABI333_31000 [bacterium]
MRDRGWLAGWLVGLLAVSLAAACGGDPSGGGGGPGDPCDPENPCRSGLDCSPGGVCVEPGDGGASGDGSTDDGGGQLDGGDPGDAGSDGGGADCPDGRDFCGTLCCRDTEVCVEDQCLLDQGPCDNDSQCQEDSYCEQGQCVPYDVGPRGPFNPGCTQLAIAGLFQPGIQCEWLGPPAGDPYPGHVRVLSAPMVVDFDFDDDPNTVEPSIVVMTYNGNDGSSGCYNGAYGVIRVLDGATCTQLYNVGTWLNGCNSPAVADLDLDGRAEIIAHDCYGGLETFTYDSGTDAFVSHCSGPLGWAAQSSGWSAPSVYDLDDDAYPEILTGAIVYDASCNVLDQTVGLTGHMYSGAGYPVVADLEGDLDGQGIPHVELATGSDVYRFDRVSRTWQALWTGGALQGYIAVADFGTYNSDPAQDDRLTPDGIAEIVSVVAPNMYIMTWEGRVIYGPVAMPSGGGGGPPTVGDFDGDGLAEVACAGSDSIAVFDPDCQGLPDMNRCSSLRTDGVLWWQPSQDHSSNRTGSSLFDFEGDGRVEVVYADEVFTRVYDGQTGEVLFSQWHSSCTWNEYPIVADVDGDFNAELVVPSNSNCGVIPSTAGGLGYPTSPNGYPMDPLFRGLRCDIGADCLSGLCDAGYCRCATDAECTASGTGSGFVCAAPIAGTPGSGNTCRAEWRGAYDGIRVYADVADRWVASRTIWSQHAYSVTHIEQDGTVVPTSLWEQNWLAPGGNNFRQNVQGDTNASSSPDMTGGLGELVSCSPAGEALLRVRVCNRGTQPVGLGVPVSFYQGNPPSGAPLCTELTTGIIVPGSCEDVSCLWTDPPGLGQEVDVTVVVDDDGTGNGQNTECEEGNNTALIPDVYCQVIGVR